MVFGILLFLFIIICIFLCLLILIQSDKGGGLNSSLGGGLSGANNFLGTQDTANVLTKGTYIFGGVFLLLCVLMTFFSPGGGAVRSDLQRFAEKNQAITATPATPLSEMMGAEGTDAENAAAVEQLMQQMQAEQAEGQSPE